jgi:hydrogenase-4 component B
MLRLWLALTVSGTVAGLSAALVVLLGAPDWEWRSAFALGGEFIHLRLDGVSALFLALLCVVGGTGAVYAREYWSEHHYPDSAPRGRAWWSALLLSMGLVLTVSNGLHFLISWELFALCGYFLITLDGRRREVRAAGWLYLAASHAGTVCLFAFFSALAARTGGWELGPLREQAGLAPLFWLALAGFGVKAGFFPLHIWLPSAHANAPSHVSAIMSGVAIKMGLYGIVRFSGWLPVPSAAGWVVIALGATVRCWGSRSRSRRTISSVCSRIVQWKHGSDSDRVGAALLAVTHGDAPWGQLRSPGRCCTYGIMAHSRRCCFLAPVLCCTLPARGR